MTLFPFPTSAPLPDPPTEQRWAPRRTLAFVVASSATLWALIIAALRILF